jgi:hypothetical protein
MGGEQSRYENRGGGGRITEVANFDFRDFNKDKETGGLEIDNNLIVTENNRLKCNGSLKVDRSEAGWELRGQNAVGCENTNYSNTFSDRNEVIHGRS